MRTFSVYRPEPPEGYVAGGFAVDVDKIQFQGVVFDDGVVAIRWFTLNGSTAVWPSLTDLQQIHGHPEYGSRWEWNDDDKSEGRPPARPPLPTSREWLDEDRGVEGAPYCGADLGTYRCTRSHSDSRHVAGMGKIVAGRWYDDGPFVEAE